jgi:hypothetical protein
MRVRMRQMVPFAVIAVSLVVALGGMAVAQSNLGTWKLNVSKSKYDPGPPPKSVTRVIEAWETDGIKETATVVQADRTRVTGGLTAHYDGKDYKSANPNFDTTAFKRANANTITFTLKRGGKVVGRGRYVVSKNGTTATETVTYMNAKGQRVHNVTVYDKQ